MSFSVRSVTFLALRILAKIVNAINSRIPSPKVDKRTIAQSGKPTYSALHTSFSKM